MAATIQCAHCGKALNAPPRLAGQRVRCSYCQQEFAVPDETGSAIRPAPGAGGPKRPGAPDDIGSAIRPTPGAGGPKRPGAPDDIGSAIRPTPGAGGPKRPEARDETLSRSMLPTMPGLSAAPPNEMVCRLVPRNLRWLGITESVKDFLGHPLDQLRQQTFLDYLHPDDRALAEDEFRQAAEQGERHDFVLRLKSASGQWRYLRIYTQARYDPDGRLNHIRCNLKDVTDEIQAEQELRRRTEQLTAANEQLRQANRKLKEAQTQLIHTEKLASLGTLAAGMAHEINNPLAFASNNVAILEREVGHLLQIIACYQEGWAELKGVNPDRAAAIARLQEEIDLPYLQKNLSRVTLTTRKGLARVAQIVQHLRGFAQIDRAEIGEIDVNESIEHCLAMLTEPLTRQHVTVVRRFGEGLPELECAPAHINQVFLNLLLNGLQAIETAGKSEGKIQITTRQEGDQFVVEITDDGCGMTAEVLTKIFDPFYTTKPLGRGTGLGLSLAHGIISDHGGSITVQSMVGVGTAFRIQVPIRRALRLPASPPAANPAPVTGEPAG